VGSLNCVAQTEASEGNSLTPDAVSAGACDVQRELLS
jgi:hypothetical protein